MHRFLTRALERRGIYTGAIPRWAEVTPRPVFYLVVNRQGAGMVRIEGGLGRRGFFVDWGNRDGIDD